MRLKMSSAKWPGRDELTIIQLLHQAMVRVLDVFKPDGALQTMMPLPVECEVSARGQQQYEVLGSIAEGIHGVEQRPGLWIAGHHQQDLRQVRW